MVPLHPALPRHLAHVPLRRSRERREVVALERGDGGALRLAEARSRAGATEAASPSSRARVSTSSIAPGVSASVAATRRDVHELAHVARPVVRRHPLLDPREHRRRVLRPAPPSRRCPRRAAAGRRGARAARGARPAPARCGRRGRSGTARRSSPRRGRAASPRARARRSARTASRRRASPAARASARRSFGWSSIGSSPSSSRKSVPPSASASAPLRRSFAPVNAPFSCPKRMLSASVGGIDPQSTTTNGPPLRSLASWIALATSSLPVPVSPRMSTESGVFATFSRTLKTRRIFGDVAHERTEPVREPDVDAVLLLRLDVDLRLADGELDRRRDERFADAERADERAVGAAEVLHEDPLVRRRGARSGTRSPPGRRGRPAPLRRARRRSDRRRSGRPCRPAAFASPPRTNQWRTRVRVEPWAVI